MCLSLPTRLRKVALRTALSLLFLPLLLIMNPREVSAQNNAAVSEDLKAAQNIAAEGFQLYNQGRYNEALEKFDTAEISYIKASAPDNPVIGVIHLNAGRCLQQLGEIRRALERYQKGLALIPRDNTGYHRYRVELLRSLGDIHMALGNYDEASVNTDEAIILLEGLLGKDSPDVADLYCNKGRVEYLRGKPAAAEKEYLAALSVYRKAGGDHSLRIAYVLNLLGETLQAEGRFSDALKNHREALALYRVAQGPQSVNCAYSYILSGEAYRAKGELDEAFKELSLGLSIYKKTYGENNTFTATAYNYLGGVYRSKKDHPTAAENFSRALEIYRKNLGEDHPYVGTAAVNLGGSYEYMGRYEEARKLYEIALKIYRSRLGSRHHFTATALNNLGLVNFGISDFASARKYLLEARSIYGETLGESHPYYANAEINIGLSYYREHDLDRAASHLEAAVKILRKSEDRYTLITALKYLAEIYRQQGKPRKAAELLENATSLIMRYRVQMGSGKTLFTAQYNDVFDELTSIYLETENYEGAFEAENKKRGLSISEGISIRDALARGGVPEEKRLKYQALLGEINDERAHNSAMMASGNFESANRLLDALIEKESRFQELQNSLVRDYPRFSQLVQPSVPGIKDLIASLAGDEAIVSYTLLPRRGVAFVITVNGLRIITLYDSESGSEALTLLAKNFHSLLKTPLDSSAIKTIVSPRGRIYWNVTADIDLYQVRGNAVETRVVKEQDFIDPAGAAHRVEAVKVVGTMGDAVSIDQVRVARKEAAQSLYEKLIAPVLKGQGSDSRPLSRLVIIPDKALYYIPFGLLTDEKGRVLATSIRYSLIHSATVWMLLGARGTETYRNPILAVGNAVYASGYSDTGKTRKGTRHSGVSISMKYTPGSDEGISRLRGQGLRNLPGTAEEISAISSIFRKKSPGEKLLTLTGAAANEDEIRALNQKGQLRDFRILHFAVHGLFVDRVPSLNSLVLTQPDILQKELPGIYKKYVKQNGPLKSDGYLQMGEIKALDISAELVVMSACETSLGHDVAGEGMVGLPQAFLIAGARSVVASLWPVDDEATALFMEEFYRAIAEEEASPAEALRKAQLILSKEYDDPFYWAPFLIYGR